MHRSQGKSQRNYKIIAVLLAAVIICAGIAAYFITRGEEEETIKIGAILSLTGAGSYSGEEVRDGMQLAVDEINAWGGINGRKVELIVKDAETSQQRSRKEFNSTEDACHPVLYVSTLSSVSMALAPLAEENQVPLVGLVASNPKLTEQKEWVFRYYQTAESEVKPIMIILEELKAEKLGVMYLNDAYGTSVFALLKEEFEKTGGVVQNASFASGEDDFEEHIDKLKDTEALYVVGFSPHLITIFEQLQEEGFNGTILASSVATFPTITHMPEANGVYSAAPIIYNPDFLFAKEVKDTYEERYDKPFNHYAANGYDFINILAGLLEDEDISRENIKSVLDEGFIHSGVFGTVTVSAGEHDMGFQLHPAQIVDEEVVFL